MSDDTTGASRSTATRPRSAEYTAVEAIVAVPASTVTTRPAVARETVTSSRMDGEIRVRLVPSAAPSVGDDTT